MKTRLTIAAVTALALPWVTAQNVIQEPQEDPVQEAIREFNQHDAAKPEGVTVVASEEKPASSEKAAETTAPKESPESAVLVTGTPPNGSELVKEGEPAPVPPPAAEEPAPKAQKGLAVRVEKLKTGTGSIDPSKVKLLAPFPAKPLGPAPAGWRLEVNESAPPITREVELSPGKKITLKIKPQILVPAADGAEVFSVSEPGFDPSLGYQQNATVGAIVSNSIRQLDDDAKKLGATIDSLQQLLVSLPKPEPQPAQIPPEPVRKR